MILMHETLFRTRRWRWIHHQKGAKKKPKSTANYGPKKKSISVHFRKELCLSKQKIRIVLNKTPHRIVTASCWNRFIRKKNFKRLYEAPNTFASSPFERCDDSNKMVPKNSGPFSLKDLEFKKRNHKKIQQIFSDENFKLFRRFESYHCIIQIILIENWNLRKKIPLQFWFWIDRWQVLC